MDTPMESHRVRCGLQDRRDAHDCRTQAVGTGTQPGTGSSGSGRGYGCCPDGYRRVTSLAVEIECTMCALELTSAHRRSFAAVPRRVTREIFPGLAHSGDCGIGKAYEYERESGGNLNHTFCSFLNSGADASESDRRRKLQDRSLSSTIGGRGWHPDHSIST